MFSCNVPLPSAVGRLANDLHPKLAGFDRVRERHTLVCKRFGVDEVGAAGGSGGGSRGSPRSGSRSSREIALARLREKLRPIVHGFGPFDVSATRIDAFDRPARGPGPVVYLAIESDGLERLHRTLCAAFDPVEGIEGDAYVPHVTLARGGDPGTVNALVGTAIEPFTWRVDSLTLYDPTFREPVGEIAL